MPRLPTGVYEQPFPDVVPDTTIESSVYNGFVNDIETDLNLPRPIVAGGTGATTAAGALTALGAIAKAGDTMTGTLAIAPGGAQPVLALKAPSSHPVTQVFSHIDNKARWQLLLGDGGPETGANAGSDLALGAWDDPGTTVTYPLRIVRSNGNINLSGAVAISNTLAVTRGNTAATVSVRSGNAAQFAGIDIGRTSTEGVIGVAASAGNFLAGTAAGDIAAASSPGRLLLGGNGDTGLALSSGKVTVVPSTNSTSVGTGALVVNGGISVSLNSYFAGSVSGAYFDATGGGAPANGIFLQTAGTLGLSGNSQLWLRGTGAGNVGRANAFTAEFSIYSNGLSFRGSAAGGVVTHIDFANSALTQCGAINVDHTALTTAYQTTSDIRGKANRAKITAPEARSIIDALEVYDFDKDGNQIRGYGVIAQQAYEVHKSLATKPEKEEDMWLVEKAAPVPFLIAALQGANQNIDKLEQRLKALEDKLAAKPG